MQRDLEALEVVCKHYAAFHGADALRLEKNRVRRLQRRIVKLESEQCALKNSNARWRQACQHWGVLHKEAQGIARSLMAALQTEPRV